METDFDKYCEDVAEFYLLLRDTGTEGKDKDEFSQSVKRTIRGKRKFKLLRHRLDDDERKDRALWRARAKALLEPGRPDSPDSLAGSGQMPKSLTWMGDDSSEIDALQNRLKLNPELLNRVLHALDRGDETYFLYLTLEVKAINEWLAHNGLYWFGHPADASHTAGTSEPGAVPDKDKRVPEAWPWKKTREMRADHRQQSRKALAEPEPLFVDDKEKHYRGEEARVLHQKRIDAYFDLCRQWEFQDKIRSWKDAEVNEAERRKATQDGDAETLKEATAKGPTLEQLVYDIFRQSNNNLLLHDLAALLFSSPKDQSKLALLLGKTPSRWLREEEAESIWVRRSMHTLTERHHRAKDSSESKETGEAKESGRWKEHNKLPPDVTGLCFSGGGIRSATFNLGILQAMAELHLLHCFDYLSTVSGGGYIHQWLAAWWKREATSAKWDCSAAAREEAGKKSTPFETVRKALVAQPISTLPGIEPTQITFLRRFSNYLTPRTGPFTADTWTLVAIWMRNTLLNQMIILSGLLVIFCLLRAALLELDRLTGLMSDRWPLFFTGLAGLLLFATPLGYIVVRLRSFARHLDGRQAHKPRAGDLWITIALLLLLVSALLFTVICAGSDFAFEAADGGLRDWLFCLGTWPCMWCLLGVLMLWPVSIGWFAFAKYRYKKAHPVTYSTLRRIVMAASGVVPGVFVAFLLAVIFRLLWQKLPNLWCGDIGGSQNAMVMAAVRYASTHPAIWREVLIVFVPPLLVAALFLVSVLHVGLNKLVFRDEVLEWMARVRALSFLVSLSWLAAAGCEVLAGPFVATLHSLTVKAWWLAATAAWGGISAGGAFAAKSQPGAGSSWLKKYARQALIAIAPYVFMVGLFLSMAALVSIVTDVSGQSVWGRWLLLFGISLTVLLLYGWQVDINEMSMHSFYRNRLARCYQGASVIDRQPDPFTGFSNDDRAIHLAELRYQPPSGTGGIYPGPFPIFCCTLNFSSGEDLAWQERKGASFAYTPLYSGYDIPWTGSDDRDLYYSGFRDTTDLGNPHGPGLADACAVSGAAVSPAWGYHTSMGMAFLMTCFNVRLGVWKRNTRYPARSSESRRSGRPKLESQSPPFAPGCLVGELFGKTDAKKEFLYLTDGGHFDNMGLYELVRRECRYIVICDAEEDGDLTFEGIAMAIRKCRTDFGVDIDLDLRAMRKAKDSDWSSVHCVVGTILYPNEDFETPSRDRGKIVYLKSTLTGAEPADTLSYKLGHPGFPHDTTADQWFSESQFESYRVLGRFIALDALKPAVESTNGVVQYAGDRRTFFDNLYDLWCPVTPAIEKHLGDHHEKIEALLK